MAMNLGASSKKERQELEKRRRAGVRWLALALISYLAAKAALIAVPHLALGSFEVGMIKAGGWFALHVFVVLALVRLCQAASAPRPVFAFVVVLGLFPLFFQAIAVVMVLTLLEHRIQKLEGGSGFLPSWDRVTDELRPLWSQLKGERYQPPVREREHAHAHAHASSLASPLYNTGSDADSLLRDPDPSAEDRLAPASGGEH